MVPVLLALVQSAATLQAGPPPLPEPPILSSGEFKSAVQEVRRSLAAKDFDKAAQLLSVLPRPDLKIQVDTEGLPEDRKTSLLAAVNDASQAIASSSLKGSLSLVSSNPDIKVSFTDSLPFIEGSKRRQAAVFFVSFTPGEPVVEAVISLERGLPLRPTERRDVGAELMHAYGLAIGLVRVPREGGMMGRVDAPVRLPLRVAQPEVLLGRDNLALVAALRQRVKDKVAEPVGEDPLAKLEMDRLQMGTAMQAGPMGLSFQISNPSSTPLRFGIVPDCSCFALQYDPIVKPGGVNLVRVQINTRDFPGPLNKALFFYSNDPDKAMLRIPVTGHVTPVYRFLRASAEQVILAPPQGAKEVIYLTHPSSRPFEILGAEASGASVKVTWEKWEGALADPEFDEPAEKRFGYQITLQIPPRREPGRYPVTLQVKTTDPDFDTLTETLTVQTGIVASPSSIFLGRIANAPSTSWFDVLRPGSPFKITKVESDTSFVTATAEPKDDGGWRVRVRFLGKAPAGLFSGVLTLHTDDSAQPKLLVPLSGVVE